MCGRAETACCRFAQGLRTRSPRSTRRKRWPSVEDVFLRPSFRGGERDEKRHPGHDPPRSRSPSRDTCRPGLLCVRDPCGVGERCGPHFVPSPRQHAPNLEQQWRDGVPNTHGIPTTNANRNYYRGFSFHWRRHRIPEKSHLPSRPCSLRYEVREEHERKASVVFRRGRNRRAVDRLGI